MILIRDIQARVARYYGLPREAMTCPERPRRIAHPRQIAMYLARELTSASVAGIGRRFGGRDHSTVFYGLRAVEQRIATDERVAADVSLLRHDLVMQARLNP